MFTKVDGLKIKHKVKEFTYIKMGHHIPESGSMISSMDTVVRNGLMELFTKDTLMRGLRRAMVHSFGLMAVAMKENLRITILKVLEIMSGLMVESMKDLGKITKCMDEVFLLGQMVVNMKVNM